MLSRHCLKLAKQYIQQLYEWEFPPAACQGGLLTERRVGVLAAFPKSTSSLGYLYMLSYIKVIVTASKYVPQALLNFRR